MVSKFKENNQFGKKYSINEQSFLKIEDEKSAYFLGFIYADGSLGKYNGDYLIRIELQEKDRNILEKLNLFLGSTRPISESFKKGRKYYKVSISNKVIYNNLLDKGLTTRKTFFIKFPNENIIPKHLMRHFIRGYFDGDGCITCSKNKKSSISFSLVSNFAFLKGMQDFLIDEIGLSETKIIATKSNEIGVLVYSGSKNAEKFYDFLYKESFLFLDRKYEKFSFLLEEINNLRKKTYKLISPSGDVFEVFNLKEFCYKNKISKKSVYALVKMQKKQIKGWKLFF
jgi:hypothetical protein